MKKNIENVGCGGRMSALNVLNDSIKRKENEIISLQTLIDNINWNSLSEKEESSLWSYFIGKR